jgi:hypothetical protein
MARPGDALRSESMNAEELKIITEARDMAFAAARLTVAWSVEMQFLSIAQKLDEILRPELIAELRNWPRP